MAEAGPEKTAAKRVLKLIDFIEGFNDESMGLLAAFVDRDIEEVQRSVLRQLYAALGNIL